MIPDVSQALAWLEKHPQALQGIQRGLERETLRVNADGTLATTGHPPALGSALTHKWITTDFAEALLEFITPVDGDIEHMLTFMRDVHRYTARQLGDERMWPLSMPCYIAPMQMVGLALTHSTSDFGNILLDVANKSILQGWDEAAETFEQWTKKGQLSDFKTAHRVGMGGFPSLRQVREGAEYKYVTTGDKGETIALATYGEIFSITRQAIINDDLNQLTDVPMKMGRAAKATIGDLVYAILTKNPKLSDGKALFHADHKNLSTGAISVSSLDDARKLMRLQKEGERSLNIRPAFMLVPVALETLANQTIKSASVKGADINAGIINPIQNFADVIAEARLDEADAKAWYLMAAKGTDTIEVAYLNGVDTPYIDQQEGFTTDGIATKVRIDAGVAPLDYRGLVKSSGQ